MNPVHKLASTVICIPARYESSRFPGKLLQKMPSGKPVIVETCYRALEANYNHVYVITDSAHIMHAVDSEFAGKVPVFESLQQCWCGTQRVAKFAGSSLQLNTDSLITVVNLQGDEPLIDPALISQVAFFADMFPTAIATAFSTPIPERGFPDFNTPICRVGQRFSSHTVGTAYQLTEFTRHGPRPIDFQNVVDYRLESARWFEHIGVYAFSQICAAPLSRMAANTAATDRQLEQLAFPHYLPIVGVHGPHCPSINTPEDLQRIWEASD